MPIAVPVVAAELSVAKLVLQAIVQSSTEATRTEVARAMNAVLDRHKTDESELAASMCQEAMEWLHKVNPQLAEDAGPPPL